MSADEKKEEPKRLRTFVIADAVWEEVQDLARILTRNKGKYVSASDIVRDGTISHAKRLRKWLEK